MQKPETATTTKPKNRKISVQKQKNGPKKWPKSNIPTFFKESNTARANYPIGTINELKAAKSSRLFVKETRQANKSYKKKLKMPNYSCFNKNESNSDNRKRMNIISNFETIVVINCILNVPLMLTSITGNALVLAAILRTPSLRSVLSVIFLCSLAITDFLVGLVGQPFYIASELYHSTDGPLSKVEALISVSLCGVSLATMTAISVDRFLALHYHVTYPNLMTTKRAMNTSASLWFGSILLSCLRVWIGGYFFLITGVFIAVCFVISCASYIKIYFIVRHHQIQIHAQQQAVNSFNITDSNNMILSKKSAVKTFIYYICMIVCYLPYLSCILLSNISVIAFDRNWSFVT